MKKSAGEYRNDNSRGGRMLLGLFRKSFRIREDKPEPEFCYFAQEIVLKLLRSIKYKKKNPEVWESVFALSFFCVYDDKSSGCIRAFMVCESGNLR